MRILFILLTILILTSSTFSPQYLIWLAPFVAFLTPVEGGMFVLSSIMTWFYFRYTGDLVNLEPVVCTVLAARNILLIALVTLSTILLFKKNK